jgi:glucose-6-phosphate 1-dehydrogenase
MPQPVTLVLFGATGDLAIKKIFPALASLFEENLLNAQSKIIAVSRRNWDTAEFRQFLTDSWPQAPQTLLSRIEYADVDFDVGRGYENLKSVLEGDTNDLLVYLSLAPQWFFPVTEDLKNSGILFGGKTKLLLEKPFGTDENSAHALNNHLLSFLSPEQIYRVDHYLGKATLQAIMRTHEESTSLREIISNETVAEITIELFETKGIDGRASYDSVGAFRDVGQNHMLEALAVLLAEYPRTDGAAPWQNARAKVIESLNIPAPDNCKIRIGQYEGYKAERGVHPDSKTETAFEIHTTFGKGELAGIPVVLRAGKCMPRNYAGVHVRFREIAGFPTHLEFEIQPEARATLRYKESSETVIAFSNISDAYRNVLKDAIAGETRHFVGGREIIAAWRYADALLKLFARFPLQYYSKVKPF